MNVLDFTALAKRVSEEITAETENCRCQRRRFGPLAQHHRATIDQRHTCAGDARLKNLKMRLDSFKHGDGAPVERTGTQKVRKFCLGDTSFDAFGAQMFHDVFIKASLPHVYGKDFERFYERIMAENEIETLQQEARSRFAKRNEQKRF